MFKDSDRKKKFIIFLVLGSFILISIPIIYKFIMDLIESKFALEIFNENYFKDLVFKISTYLSFYNFKFDNPLKVFGYVIIGYYIITYMFSIFTSFKPKEKYEQTDDYGSHGTSRWQNNKEINNNYYNDNLGWFLGANEKVEKYKIGMNGAYHRVNGDLNMQCVVIGPPGSNKTTGFVLPNIFHLVDSYKNRNVRIKKYKEILKDKDNLNIIKIINIRKKYKDVIIPYKDRELNLKGIKGIKKIQEIIKNKADNFKNRILSNFKLQQAINEEMPDFIITDPKSELYCLTSKYLEENNYDVKVLDFINLKYGDSINPIEFIEDDKTLLEICKGFVESVEGSRSEGGTSGDMAFWNGQEAQLLGALVGYIKQTYPKEEQVFKNVLKLLTSENVYDEYKSKQLFKKANIKGTPLQLWNNFLAVCDNERTKSNVVGGLAEKMVLFSIEGIAKITQKTTIDLTKMGAKKKKPMALFILMPDGDRTFSPIINVMVSILFKQLYKNAYKTNNRLEMPLFEILEEMANIGKIPNKKELLGTMRGRRIYPMMIWQSLAQMRDRYKDGFEDIMSMCDSHIYLGVNDGFTSKYCSNSLGDTTIKIEGTSKKGDNGLLTVNDRSQSTNYNSRKLMLPDEIERLNNDLMIIRQRANYPALLYKVQYKYWEEKICEEVRVDKLRKLSSLPENEYDHFDNGESSQYDRKIDVDKEREINYKDYREVNYKEESEEEGGVFDNVEVDDYMVR